MSKVAITLETVTPTGTLTLTRSSSLGVINAPVLSPIQVGFALSTVPDEDFRPEMLPVSADQSDESYADFLPTEIIFKIFEYLGVTAVCRSGQVCKRWRNISQDEILWKKRYERLWVISDFETVRFKYRHRLTATEFRSQTWFQKYGVLFKSTFIWKTSSRMIEENTEEMSVHSNRQLNLQQHVQHIQIVHQQLQQQTQQIQHQIAPQNQPYEETNTQIEIQQMEMSAPIEISNNNNNNDIASSESQTEHSFSYIPPTSTSSSTLQMSLNVSSSSRSPRNREISSLVMDKIEAAKIERIAEELEIDLSIESESKNE